MSRYRKSRRRSRAGRQGSVNGRSRRGNLLKRLIVLLAFFTVAAIIITIFIDNKVRPMIEIYGHNQAKTTGTQAIHRAVETVIGERSISYDDLSKVNKTESGEISSIETNTHNMNVIKSMISEKVLAEIDENSSQDIKIPVGSLVGGLVTGRGPSVIIKVPMNSSVEVHFSNEFGSAGINQTRHIIGMKVEVTTLIVAQGEKIEVVVVSDFVIAEQIIVGEVPSWAAGALVSG